jgi:hypothetical protein
MSGRRTGITQDQLDALKKQLSAEFEKQVSDEVEKRLNAAGQTAAGSRNSTEQQRDLPPRVKEAKAAAAKFAKGSGATDKNRYEEDKSSRKKVLEERKPTL